MIFTKRSIPLLFCTCSLAFREMFFTSYNSLGCWTTDPNQPTFTGWHGWSGELARLHFSHYQWKWQATDTQQFECECVSLSISGSSVGSYTQQPTVEWSEWPTQHWESHWLVLVSCYIGIHTGLLVPITWKWRIVVTKLFKLWGGSLYCTWHTQYVCM